MSAEMEKKKVAEKVWLDYFNEYLFEHGLIDEMTRNKLRIKIITTAAVAYARSGAQAA